MYRKKYILKLKSSLPVPSEYQIMGEHTLAATYKTKDVVYSGGKLYASRVDNNLNHAVTDTDYWDVVVFTVGGTATPPKIWSDIEVNVTVDQGIVWEQVEGVYTGKGTFTHGLNTTLPNVTFWYRNADNQLTNAVMPNSIVDANTVVVDFSGRESEIFTVKVTV